jgi:hypothetical protein
MAVGDFIALLDHDDELREHALYMAVVLNAHPEVDLLYSDEDKVNGNGRRYDPYFKPNWNPELFLAQNFTSHLSAYRTRIVNELGGFRAGYERAQDWDLAMRVIEAIASSHIRHIPHVLYHWRAIPGSAALANDEKSYTSEAQRKTLESHFERVGMNVEIRRGVLAHQLPRSGSAAERHTDYPDPQRLLFAAPLRRKHLSKDGLS